MFNVQTLGAEKRVEKAVVNIMQQSRYIPLAGVLLIGYKKVCDDVPTACTNGRDESYGRAFVDSLPDSELRFLILHECYHKLYKHLTTWYHMFKKDPDLANMACDFVINLRIQDENKDGFAKMLTWKEDHPEFPKPVKKGDVMGCIDEKYRGMNEYQVFQDLLQQQEANGGGGGGGEPGEGDGTGISGEGGGQTPTSGDGTGGGFDEHQWEDAHDLTEEEVKKLEQEVDRALRQGMISAGKSGSANAEHDYDDLLRVKTPWTKLMADFMIDNCKGHDFASYNRPNRRFIGAGIYMPTSYTEQVEEVGIFIDTSGSMFYRNRMSYVMSNLRLLLASVRPKKIRLLYWDTCVTGDEVYGTYGFPLDGAMKQTKVRGGGGTMVECVCEYVKEHKIKPQVAVILTDGELGGGWGKWDMPVIWGIVNENERNVPTVGKHVYINH